MLSAWTHIISALSSLTIGESTQRNVVVVPLRLRPHTSDEINWICINCENKEVLEKLEIRFAAIFCQRHFSPQQLSQLILAYHTLKNEIPWPELYLLKLLSTQGESLAYFSNMLYRILEKDSKLQRIYIEKMQEGLKSSSAKERSIFVWMMAPILQQCNEEEIKMYNSCMKRNYKLISSFKLINLKMLTDDSRNYLIEQLLLHLKREGCIGNAAAQVVLEWKRFLTTEEIDKVLDAILSKSQYSDCNMIDSPLQYKTTPNALILRMLLPCLSLDDRLNLAMTFIEKMKIGSSNPHSHCAAHYLLECIRSLTEEQYPTIIKALNDLMGNEDERISKHALGPLATIALKLPVLEREKIVNKILNYSTLEMFHIDFEITSRVIAMLGSVIPISCTTKVYQFACCFLEQDSSEAVRACYNILVSIYPSLTSEQ